MTIYPNGIDSATVELPDAIDNTTPIKAEVINRLRDAIIAVEAELGIKPSGVYTTVRLRLDALEAVLDSLALNGDGGTPLGPALGDLTGNYPSPQVKGLRGITVSSTVPTSGQVLAYNGTQWAPATISGTGGAPNGTAGGDLSGDYPNPLVYGLYGRPITNSTPSIGQALVWDGNKWDYQSSGGGSGTLVGDVTGPIGSNIVETLTGINNKVIIIANELSWDGYSYSIIKQAAPASESIPTTDLNIQSQAPDGYAGTFTGRPGNINYIIPPPVGGAPNSSHYFFIGDTNPLRIDDDKAVISVPLYLTDSEYSSVGDALIVDTDGLITTGSVTASGPAGGDLSGTYPNPVVSTISGDPLTSEVNLSADIAFPANWIPTIYQKNKLPSIATQPGQTFEFSAQNATAGLAISGAGAGGNFQFTTGNAARFNTGNDSGGEFKIVIGSGIGTGSPSAHSTAGGVQVFGPTSPSSTGNLQTWRYGTSYSTTPIAQINQNGMMATKFTVGATGGATITTGTSVPSASEVDGSIYLRNSGSSSTALYTRQSGAWSAIGGADLTNVSTTINFANTLIAAITQSSPSSSGTPTTGLNFISQAPHASAGSLTGTPGNIIFTIPAAVGSAPEASMYWNIATKNVARMDTDRLDVDGYVIGVKLFPNGSTGPNISSTSSAPSASESNGSLFLRTDGYDSSTAYVRADNSWSALAAAITVDVRTTAAGIGSPYAPTRNAWRSLVVNQTSGAAYYINLPSTPQTGDLIHVKDGKGDAATNNITINGNGKTIDGSSSLVINTNYGVSRLIYNGTQWNVI